MKPKVSKRKKIKIRADIIETETKKITEKISVKLIAGFLKR